MKAGTRFLLIFVGLLLVTDLSWRVWTWNANADLRATSKLFKVEILNTNNILGIGIADAKTGKPLWIQWNDSHGKPDAISYFLHGINVLNLHLKGDKPPAYDVIFYGPGRSQTWWWDLGRGTFMTRTFYNTNGDFSTQEIWYDQTWHTVDRRNGCNGIVINGQWRGIGFDTNGMWTTEINTNQ